MIHEILPVGMLRCNCSVFGDEQSREALVVDPGDEIDSVLRIVAKHSLTVKAIVITRFFCFSITPGLAPARRRN